MNETVNVKIIPDDPGAMVVRALIVFGVTASLSVALIWLQRKASSPDFILTAKMRSFNSVANYADSRANFWHKISAKATHAYLDSRP